MKNRCEEGHSEVVTHLDKIAVLGVPAAVAGIGLSEFVVGTDLLEYDDALLKVSRGLGRISV
jgi:hypothetical protein